MAKIYLTNPYSCSVFVLIKYNNGQKMLTDIPKDLNLPKKNVLILDDQNLILSVHKAIINSMSNKFKLNVLTAKDRVEAQNILDTVSLDLIITDHLMEDVGSESFIQYVKDSPLNKHTPIIIGTAVKDLAVHAQLISLGVSACLLKPLNKTELVEISNRLLCG